MNIHQNIRKNHESLSRRSGQFLDYVAGNPACLDMDHYNLLELNDPLFKLQPWPTFTNRQTGQEMEAASIKVLNLIRSIPSRIFAHDYEKIGAYYKIPVNLVEYMLAGFTDSDIDNLLARGDFVLSANGLKCLEYNVNPNLGGLQLSFWKSLYLNTPIIADFFRRNHVKTGDTNLFSILFAHLLQAALDRFPGSQEEINVAVAMPNYTNTAAVDVEARYYNAIYQDLLEESGDLKGEVIVCGYPQLDVSAGGVWYGKRRIHSIVEWYQGFVPARIMDVFKEGNVLIYNGPIAWLLSTKLNLVLLSELEDSGLLSNEERDIIKKYIPWSRQVTVGESTYQDEQIRLESFILANREKLVLKPVVGAGGKGIYIGRNASAAEWQAVVAMALKEDNREDLKVETPVTEKQAQAFIARALSMKSWMVQEYAESLPYLYQWGENGCTEHHAIWGYFVFGNRYAGSWVRVLPTGHGRGIINCHQGARVSVVFEVEE